ncbi:hypothetical protein DYY67_2089 [Candidatus Nitrosotalea sp. TS]|uniref:hypothetical protein n=1 Tax=Candidatus Nitrosotalea sp. TS TaxID=2341020 RepID=UPI00140E6B1D|nr:hypothetical protein [Candidatus Nitrosotalea sp. TS]NHI04162.1 hypothetical protein [Candidatus Nitrosotalea sp. TS]
MRVKESFPMLVISVVILFGLVSAVPAAFAATWYPGEGLKQGDYYQYKVCTADWHNCEPITDRFLGKEPDKFWI